MYAKHLAVEAMTIFRKFFGTASTRTRGVQYDPCCPCSTESKAHSDRSTRLGRMEKLLRQLLRLIALGRARGSNGCAPTMEWRPHGYGCLAQTFPGSRRPRFSRQVRCYLDGSWLSVMCTQEIQLHADSAPVFPTLLRQDRKDVRFSVPHSLVLNNRQGQVEGRWGAKARLVVRRDVRETHAGPRVSPSSTVSSAVRL